MERNWKERAFSDEYIRQKARDQYLIDNKKPTSNRYKNMGTAITLGAVAVITVSLFVNFSGLLGIEAADIFDRTLVIPIIALLGLFFVFLRS